VDVDIATVGKGRGSTVYHIRLFGDFSRRYRVSLSIRWRSLNKPEVVGTFSWPDHLTVDFQQDWRSLVRGSKKSRILFNGRIDRLIPQLDKLTQPMTYEILVADPLAVDFIRSRGIKVPDNVTVLTDAKRNLFNKLLSPMGPNNSRPANFIAVEGGRFLLQHPNDPYMGSLLQDEDKARAILQRFDTAVRSHR
jgi:hypothetical protein